jgi:hypothetical protein
MLLATVAVLAVPVAASIANVRRQTTDSGFPGRIGPRNAARISAFLQSHRHGARYEFAAGEAANASSIIVRDAQPVLELQTLAYHQIVSARRLRTDVARGRVRYMVLERRPTPCPHPVYGPPVLRWAMTHSRDITRTVGIKGCGMLYELSTQPQNSASSGPSHRR